MNGQVVKMGLHQGDHNHQDNKCADHNPGVQAWPTAQIVHGWLRARLRNINNRFQVCLPVENVERDGNRRFDLDGLPLQKEWPGPSSQAIRGRVNTGVRGRRRSIDMVASEYANFAPQSQHTRYVRPSIVKTRLSWLWWQPNRKSMAGTSLAIRSPLAGLASLVRPAIQQTETLSAHSSLSSADR